MSNDTQIVAIGSFCAGFIVSGLIAGWAGMWKRPAKGAYVCSSCNAVSAKERPSSEPAWYDFLLGYPIIRWLTGSWWRASWHVLAWPFRSGAVLAIAPLIMISLMFRSCAAERAAAAATAKSWCERRGCEVLECFNSGSPDCGGSAAPTCQIRFPGQRAECRDCRGSECSPVK
jgi:hypothetical protein